MEKEFSDFERGGIESSRQERSAEEQEAIEFDFNEGQIPKIVNPPRPHQENKIYSGSYPV